MPCLHAGDAQRGGREGKESRKVTDLYLEDAAVCISVTSIEVHRIFRFHLSQAQAMMHNKQTFSSIYAPKGLHQ